MYLPSQFGQFQDRIQLLSRLNSALDITEIQCVHKLPRLVKMLFIRLHCLVRMLFIKTHCIVEIAV